MLVHTVFFWLKRDLDSAQREAFLAGVESLRGIASVDTMYVGTPSATYRPIIDRTYDIGLTVLMKDLEAHDAYQVDPIHLKFVEQFGPYWERAVIYDAD
jgi:hypothetical protein